jgi:RimJ/RimL family protein N-acetyltransferase
VSDGVVTLRPFETADREALIAGRDREVRRWLGPGSEQPAPTACVIAAGATVGWVDYDDDQPWLEPGEVNIGYAIFAPHRRRGLGSRAVQLLAHHLAVRTDVQVMTLSIDPANAPSTALAQRLGYRPDHVRPAQPAGEVLFARPVPPLRYRDGVVTVRPLDPRDIDRDLEAKDDAQIRWLWQPGERQAWRAMSAEQQRAHAHRGLVMAREDFGRGPKWRFAGDLDGDAYVVYVDCDLACVNVPLGEANIAYATHPAYRNRGLASRAVRLILEFLHDHTAASEAHLLVDERNIASRRVARAVGAEPVERFVDRNGSHMIRHVVPVR